MTDNTDAMSMIEHSMAHPEELIPAGRTTRKTTKLDLDAEIDRIAVLIRDADCRCPHCWNGQPCSRCRARAVVEAMHAPATPRVWVLPDEPGPEVTAVRDREGFIWRRRAAGGWGECTCSDCLVDEGRAWSDVMDGAPLTDATDEVATEGGAA